MSERPALDRISCWKVEKFSVGKFICFFFAFVVFCSDQKIV